MEIGFWAPFSVITNGFTSSYEDRRQRLLTDRVPRLKKSMGREYCEAVRCCIECDFGGLQSIGQKEMSSKDLLSNLVNGLLLDWMATSFDFHIAGNLCRK